ncbi:uncharacterized protein TrAFT101_001291 [Trichoderma asperellum]|uniref:uncharacterized protein n=1 Tax=Trichoderma asperellum TaxID=101201 RepID=UPI00331D58A9|nr:hypothetical protein TrAFT101_001291 [Trichoderma asperellum]
MDDATTTFPVLDPKAVLAWAYRRYLLVRGYCSSFIFFLACAEISWCGKGTGTYVWCLRDPLCGSWVQET